MKVWLILFLILSSCSTLKPKVKTYPFWNGLPATELDKNAELSKLTMNRESEEDVEVRHYVRRGKFQTKAYCSGIGGCMGVPQEADCNHIFTITNHVITKYETKDCRPDEMIKPAALIDSVMNSFSEGGISKPRFNRLLTLFEKFFSPYAQSMGREFEILSDFHVDWAQAFARRWEKDQLIVYGGVARIPGMTEDALALVLCHEVGHLYGRSPFGDSHNQLSVEGQADYWATSHCFEKIIPVLEISDFSLRDRGIKASLIITSYFASNRNLPPPQIETPDGSIAEETLKIHPSPQCRLDTLIRGLDQELRPECWFKN